MSSAGSPPPPSDGPPPGAPPPGGPVGPPPGGAGASTTMLMLPHLLGLFTGFLGPLIIYLVPNDDPRVRGHAAAALNWQLSLIIYLLVSTGVLVLLGLAVSPVFFLLFLVFFALLLYDLVICVMAAVKGNNGEPARYPGAIPMVRA